MAVVRKIWATWSELAERVEQKAIKLEIWNLEWEIFLRHVSRCDSARQGVFGVFGIEPVIDYWEGYSAVRMVSQSKIGSIGNEDQTVSVPITEVSNIIIGVDGTFKWNHTMVKPGEDKEIVDRLFHAVCEGKVCSGQSCCRKWLPAGLPIE